MPVDQINVGRKVVVIPKHFVLKKWNNATLKLAQTAQFKLLAAIRLLFRTEATFYIEIIQRIKKSNITVKHTRACSIDGAPTNYRRRRSTAFYLLTLANYSASNRQGPLADYDISF